MAVCDKISINDVRGVYCMDFVFDIGNVLVNFKPKPFLQTLFHNPLLEDKINEIIFRSTEWIKLDMGTITQEEAYAEFCRKEPEYRDIIIETVNRIPDMLTPIMPAIGVLPKVREAGHRLFYLSNYHRELSRYIQQKYDFFSLFDGGVFSCDVHMVKPDPGIYRYFLDKYSLNPQDCVFFDDTEENIRGAQASGMRGILFSGVDEVIKCLKYH